MGQRDDRGRFVKGKSGNPGGKRKVEQEFVARCQSHWEQALNVALSIMNAERAFPSDRLAAAKFIIEHGFGKPRQTQVNMTAQEWERSEVRFVTPEGEGVDSPFPPYVPGESETH